MFWYRILNYFFFGFHTLLILFNTLGWAVKKTRKWNLITLLLTALSWFGLGIWYGWGYCVCTDWHWRVREYLGYHDMPNSYIKFLILKLTGIDFPSQTVDTVTAVVFFLSLMLSIIFNIKDIVQKKDNNM
jgi:hypothetical protein